MIEADVGSDELQNSIIDLSHLKIDKEPKLRKSKKLDLQAELDDESDDEIVLETIKMNKKDKKYKRDKKLKANTKASSGVSSLFPKNGSVLALKSKKPSLLKPCAIDDNIEFEFSNFTVNINTGLPDFPTDFDTGFYPDMCQQPHQPSHQQQHQQQQQQQQHLQQHQQQQQQQQHQPQLFNPQHFSQQFSQPWMYDVPVPYFDEDDEAFCATKPVIISNSASLGEFSAKNAFMTNVSNVPKHEEIPLSDEFAFYGASSGRLNVRRESAQSSFADVYTPESSSSSSAMTPVVTKKRKPSNAQAYTETVIDLSKELSMSSRQDMGNETFVDFKTSSKNSKTIHSEGMSITKLSGNSNGAILTKAKLCNIGNGRKNAVPVTFTCSYCAAKFKVKGYLSRHLKKHSSHKAFSCPFYSDGPVHGDGAVNCAISKCHPTGGFSRKDTYKTHLKALHFVYPPGTKPNQRMDVSGKCSGCMQKFLNNNVWLDTHIENGACEVFKVKRV